MVKVSIIIPVYNSQLFVPGCLDSILAQRFTDYEIICVDDGSSDGSVDLLRDYTNFDDRISVIETVHNSGPGHARNLGIDQAQGEYLCFIDSDDWMDELLLEKAVGKAEATNADMVIWDAWLWNNRLSLKRRAHSVYPERFGGNVFSWKDNPDLIFQSFQNWPWNKLFRASFVKEYNLRFQAINRTEDLMFTCSALVKAQRITCIDEPLSFYRIGREGSAMSTKDPYAFDFYKAYVALKDYLKGEGLYEPLRRSFDNWVLSGVLYNLETLKTAESYHDVFNFIRTEGLAQLGLEPKENGYYYDKRWLEGLKYLMQDDSNLYLLARLARLNDLLDDEMTRSSTYECERDDLTRDRKRLQSLVEAREAENDQLRRELHEQRLLHDETAQRVGKAVCRLPRALVRGFRKRGN